MSQHSLSTSPTLLPFVFRSAQKAMPQAAICAWAFVLRTSLYHAIYINVITWAHTAQPSATRGPNGLPFIAFTLKLVVMLLIRCDQWRLSVLCGAIMALRPSVRPSVRLFQTQSLWFVSQVGEGNVLTAVCLFAFIYSSLFTKLVAT